MFRGKQKTKMMNDQFGIGSILIGAPSEKWLVIGVSDNKATLLDLNTMQCSDDTVTVFDQNFISETEARELANLTGLNYTFSDFDFNARGYKP